MKDRHARYLFLFSVAFLAYITGVLTGAFEFPPYKLASKSIRNVLEFAVYWENDLGIEPTRHLAEASGPRDVWNVLEAARLAPGLRLIGGLDPDGKTLYSVRLFDPAGRLLHRWPVDYARFDPGGLSPNNVALYGFEVFADGAMVVNFGTGNALAKIDPCGNPVWVNLGRYHHAVGRSFDGSIWAWKTSTDRPFDQLLVQIDSGDGKILREISLIEDVIRAGDQMGIFGILRDDQPYPSGFRHDPFHANDIEVLGPDIADAFPAFAAGDLMISLRTPNLVAVLDPETLKAKWWQHGPWHRQHDPDFQPDGTITVFDNRLDLGDSQIIRLDPQSGKWSIAFRGSREIPFYTRMRGQHEVLGNGNLLLTNANSGNVLEVTPDGDLVWDYQNVFDDKRNGVVSMATLVPEDFFAPDALTCAAE